MICCDRGSLTGMQIDPPSSPGHGECQLKRLFGIRDPDVAEVPELLHDVVIVHRVEYLVIKYMTVLEC